MTPPDLADVLALVADRPGGHLPSAGAVVHVAGDGQERQKHAEGSRQQATQQAMDHPERVPG